jgi:hypothetical protein
MHALPWACKGSNKGGYGSSKLTAKGGSGGGGGRWSEKGRGAVRGTSYFLSREDRGHLKDMKNMSGQCAEGCGLNVLLQCLLVLFRGERMHACCRLLRESGMVCTMLP